MFKINSNQFIEGSDFFHRTFRSGLHKDFQGATPALNLFDMYQTASGAEAIRLSSHIFDLLQPPKNNSQ